MTREDYKKLGMKGHMYLIIQEAKRAGFLCEYEGVVGNYEFVNKGEKIRDRIDYFTKYPDAIYWKSDNDRFDNLVTSARLALDELKTGEYGIHSAYMLNNLFSLMDAIPEKKIIPDVEEVPVEKVIEKAIEADEFRSQKKMKKIAEEAVEGLDNLDLGDDLGEEEEEDLVDENEAENELNKQEDLTNLEVEL